MRAFGKPIGIAAILSGAVVATASPASAVVMLAHFTGVVGADVPGDRTFDTTDFFGLGDDLVGARFEATFRYDTDLGFATTDTLTDTRSGGPDWMGGSFASPILNAFITINGVTDTFDVGRNGSANVTINPTGWRQTFFYTDSYLYPVENALQLWVLNTPDPLRLDTAYTGGNITGLGRPLTDPFAYSFVEGGKNYRLALETETVTLSRAAIPEPSAWLLMILGFGVAGAAVRRARVAAAQATTA